MKPMKLDPVVKKEVGFMAIAALVCTILVQAGFWVLSFFTESILWDYTVLLGGLVGWCLTMLNFFLMCLGVQRSVSDPDPRHAQLMMKASYSRRSVLILGVLIVAFVVKQIHWFPVAAAVFYPTISIFVRQFWSRYVLKKTEDPPAGVPAVPYEEEEEGGEDEFEKAVGRFAGKIDTDYLKDTNPEGESPAGEKEG